MKLRDIMIQPAQVVRPDATLREAAAIMRACGTSSIPVCEGQQMKGILCDRDLVVHGAARGLDPMRSRVSDVMNRDLAFAYEDQLLEDAASIMDQHHVERLLILSRDQHLVGCVAKSDIALQMQFKMFDGRLQDRAAVCPVLSTLH